LLRIRIDFSRLDPDPEEISFLEMLDVLFLGLKASPVAWTSFMEAWE
jgi:hypothetical protein